MGNVRSGLEKLRWYFSNLPVVSFTLFVLVMICYKIRLARHFSDVALCVQPHMVMTGQVTRLIKYAVHHKNASHLVLSLASLASVGTMVERQAGSIRYLSLMTLFAVLSASLTVFFSILLGFSSHYYSIMYSCPALGLMPTLFSTTVLLFQSLPFKKTIIYFCAIPNKAIPWLLLIFLQFVLQDMTFISNLSGCIVGSLYCRCQKSLVTSPSSVALAVDGIFAKVFKYIPPVKYIPSTGPQLPIYHNNSVQSEGSDMLQPFRVPDDCPVPVTEDSVSSSKLEKLMQMGFSKEESVVSLMASSNDVDQAVSILVNNQIGPHAAVLPTRSLSS